jgi:hypothetical protein
MNTETKISKKQFISDVIAELKNIKKHATPIEINRLDFESFNPKNMDHCIYGQMTGNCLSLRASELIFLCCKRYVENRGYASYNKLDFKTLKPGINGPSIGETVGEFGFKRGWVNYLSSLESYIMLEESKLKYKKIFAFLKGETEIIKL